MRNTLTNIEVQILKKEFYAFLFFQKQGKKFALFGKQKTLDLNQGFVFAEKEGFEPPDLLQSTVFKTAAFDRSAISPVVSSGIP